MCSIDGAARCGLRSPGNTNEAFAATSAVWQTVVEDAGDGTGDGFVVLPNDLLTRLGWAPGDPLESVTAPAGMVILRRKE